MVLKAFERKLEQMVEGAFARVFQTGIRPVEIGRRLMRELDDQRSVDVRGRTIVPNAYTVHLSPADHDRFADVAESLRRNLADLAREHADDEGYHFLGPITVDLTGTDRLRTGTFQVEARFVEAHSGTPGGDGVPTLVLPSGDRITLGSEVISIGRLPECAVVLNDPNVSRQHAEIRPDGVGFVIVDLNSTNGTRVNGVRIQSRELAHGDEVRIGNASLRFLAS